MHTFPRHSLESAPERSQPAMRGLQQAFGTLPNIGGAMATSPVLINSLVGVFHNVHTGSFTEKEIQTLLLTNAVTNGAAWPVAFHTALALKNGLNPADVEAIRNRRAPVDARSAALSTLSRTLIEKRGQLDDHDVDPFMKAGFDQERLLEVVAIVAASTMTNYAASITGVPLEESLEAHRWKPV